MLFFLNLQFREIIILIENNLHINSIYKSLERRMDIWEEIAAATPSFVALTLIRNIYKSRY